MNIDEFIIQLLSTNSAEKQQSIVFKFTTFKRELFNEKQILNLVEFCGAKIAKQEEQGKTAVKNRKGKKAAKYSKGYAFPKFRESFKGCGNCCVCTKLLNGRKDPVAAFFHNKGFNNINVYCPDEKCFPQEFKMAMECDDSFQTWKNK